jgi:transposase InsO family protein
MIYRLGERIVRIYQENRQVYGSPRIHAALRAEGQPCGKKRVARLMRERGLSAKPRKHRTRTTDSQHEQPVAPNLLNREFTPQLPIRNGWPISQRSGRRRAGSIWRSCSTSFHGWWSAGPWMCIAMRCWWIRMLLCHLLRPHNHLGSI